jgi:hypothetical protein
MSETNKNKNEEPKSLLSPLLTNAQDRKRKILERRAGLTRSHSLPASLHLPTTCSPARGAPSDMEPVVRRRRCSQASVGSSSRSRLFEHTSTCDDTAATTTTTHLGGEAKARSSLFGAVMKTSTPSKPPRVSWDPSTPNRSTLPHSSTDITSFESPGGFGLLKLLDSVASPFRGKEGTPTKSPVPMEPAEWTELALDATEITDWSIQPRLRIECHPGHLLPSSIHGKAEMEQEGFDRFVMGTAASPEAQWEAAMLYWQYPPDVRQQQQPSEVASLWNTEFSIMSAKPHATKPELATKLANDMIKSVRGPTATLHKLARNLVDGNDKRRREWQDAFRSLYFAWRRTLESKHGYCYAVLPYQIILFRPQIHPDGAVIPMVVMTSSTMDLRRRLRRVGVQLYTLPDQTRFDEEMWAQPKISTNKEISTPIRSDLEALRKAQAFGETAGADVSVSTKLGKRSTSRKIPALYMTGDDDCAAFFEIYMNSGDPNELPTLLSRRVGHFLHASIKTLRTTHRREEHQISNAKNSENCASLELRGPILPCAISELMQATAAKMSQDAQSSGSRHSSKDEEIGSHYFVMQTSPIDVAIYNSSCLLNSATNLNSVSTRVWDVSRKNIVTIKWE